MWRSWAKSPVRVHDTLSPPPSFSHFSCTSFKDVQTLCSDDPSPPTTKKLSIFHRVRLANSLIRSLKPDPNPLLIPGAETRVVIYFTSLRIVRSTFEDCRAVRSIFRSFKVKVDERDLSMDSAFLNELQKIMGCRGKKLTLPRVFIGGRYIGGAEEVRQLNETGELKKFVEGLPAAEMGVCHMCGGHRFILCDECNGSRKLHTEKGGFRMCTDCNENGLIRCPSCSSAVLDY